MTKEAQAQAREARSWWRENRDKNPGLFQQELDAARKLLSQQPDAGKNYAVVDGVKVQRLLLEKTRRHLYYFIDEASQIVRITGIRGAQRKDEPDLEEEVHPDDEPSPL